MRRTWQPQGPARVDWSNPITRGITNAYPMSSLQDAAHGYNLSASPYSVLAPNRWMSLYRATNAYLNPNTATNYPVLGTGAFSAVTWFLTSASSSGPYSNYIWAFGGDSNDNGQISLSVESGVLYCRSGYYNVHGGSGLADGTWHCAGVCKPAGASPAGTSLYVDGVALTSLTNNSSTAFDFVTGAPLWVGAVTLSGAGFVGYLGPMTFWARALEPAEFRSMYLNRWQVYARSPRRTYILPSAGPITVSLAEAASAGDQVSVRYTAAGSLAESVGAADALTGIARWLSAVAESGAASDALTGASTMLAGLTESSAASDATSSTATAAVSLAASSVAADTPSGTATWLASRTESVAAADAITAGNTAVVLISESTSSSDALTGAATWTQALAGSADATDALTGAATAVTALTGAATAADTLSAALKVSRVLKASAAGSDVLSAVATLQSSLAALASPADALSASTSGHPSLAESSLAADLIACGGVLYTVGLEEQSAAVDALHEGYLALADLTEAGTPSDQILAVATIRMALEEAAHALDAISASGIWQVVIADAADATDVWTGLANVQLVGRVVLVATATRTLLISSAMTVELTTSPTLH